MAKNTYNNVASKFDAKGKQPKKERFNDVEFVSLELSEEQKGILKAQELVAGELDELALKLTESGYRISLKWDTFNECHACYLQSIEETGTNAGAILTGRGSTPLKALRQALFKHYVVLREDWGSHRKSRQREVIDD